MKSTSTRAGFGNPVAPGIVDCQLPIDHALSSLPLLMPCRRVGAQCLDRGNTTLRPALPSPRPQRLLGPMSPTAMRGGGNKTPRVGRAPAPSLAPQLRTRPLASGWADAPRLPGPCPPPGSVSAGGGPWRRPRPPSCAVGAPRRPASPRGAQPLQRLAVPARSSS